ncbi:putative ubiquitin c-terminal hydrolase [Phaeomoniella chlamydospora]|uniref:ubiquitinyl hydrolase 1 n=1 Tax=Phaeomoniella chlamydospora TaxID=158046 RepID=A0A0G2ED12_PHACM|nr:putative ubiquitin c-terminal hydrolase [Phaeomoniella chlamydospora]
MPNSAKSERSTPEQEAPASQHFRKKHEKRNSLRSLSPAVKRPASDMGAQDREDHSQDANMELGQTVHAQEDQSRGNEQTPKAKQQNRGPRISVDDSAIHESTPKSHAQTAPSETSTINTVSTNQSTVSTAPTSLKSSSSPSDTPSIDEQVEKVTSLAQQTPKDRQKGFIVSQKWLNRVLARSSVGASGEKFDKTAAEGEIGPVDNSDIVMVTEESGKLKDEAGEPFVFLKPGLQIGDDYQILPQEAWDLIVQWYGISKKSPIITRYAHNTSLNEFADNIQYELIPPVFSLLKLSGTQGSSTKFLKETDTPPIKYMASRSTPFNVWLRKAKDLTGIDMKTKVRVWRILGGLKSSNKSGILTPAGSRSASPAPGAEIRASAGDKLVLDNPTFAALQEGTDKELMAELKDQTANEKYNGSQTLDHAGLSRDEVVLLEEQIGGPGGGEWASQGVKPSPLTVSKASSLEKTKAKAASIAGRTSPAPGVVTRGRQRRDGRPRGIVGLSNLGNTCYMNSALQCVRSVEELSQYFLHDVYKKDLNPSNPLAHNGEVARAYGNFLLQIYGDSSQSSFAPRHMKQTIGKYGPNFSGYGQQDSQEFLLFLLDGLQEDLNRVLKKPYIEKPDSTDEMVHNPKLLEEMADKCWDIYTARNDSVITDLFAGMYKSTLHCPVCDKVSIIFDPFNNLTLQLPVENNWSKEVFFFPLHGKPIRLDVDIDKNASIKQLKEYVGKRMNADATKMIMAEIYKCKLYKLFENPISIAEAGIQPADNIGIFELEDVPTNYNADKYSRRSTFSSQRDEDIPSADSPAADKLVVSVFNRLSKPGAPRSQQKQIYAFPSFVVFTKEEARNYESVQKKLLAAVASMTTRDILNEENPVFHLANKDEEISEDPDAVSMNDDDNSSDSNHVHAKSVEGEEGLVDVTMANATPAGTSTDGEPDLPATIPKVLRPGAPIPLALQNMYEIKFIRTGEMIPTGISSFDESKDYPSISTRMPKPASRRSKGSSEISVSSDEDADELSPSDQMQLSGYGSDVENKDHISDSDHDLPSPDSLLQPQKVKTHSQKGREVAGKTEHLEYEGPLVGPGDAILLEWTPEAHDALFGGSEGSSNELRGTGTWLNVEMFKDEELAAKRAQRQSRRRKGITLDDCLDEFGKEEILSENDAWYCPRCKEHRRASKKFELWKTPDILVMHLKRFSSNRNFRDKLEIMVDYPVEGLDMSNRVLVQEKGKEVIYDLFAVDNHYGGLGGGHYTAYAKNFFDNNWYEYNDSHVSKRSDPQAVVTPAAYLLFYRRRSSRPLGGPALEKVVEDANNPPADNEESSPPSRSESPPNESGEGRRLGGSSRNGSSSALTAVAAAHRAGDGGSAQQKQSAGASHEDGSLQNSRGRMNDDQELPGYSVQLQAGERRLSTDPMDVDEGLGDETAYGAPYSEGPSWSFDMLSNGRGVSRITAAPPSSFVNEEEDDLFADDASTRAEVAGGSSVEALSDNEDRMGQFEEVESISFTGPRPRGTRESAPPPFGDEDDEDELSVVELRNDDDG